MSAAPSYLPAPPMRVTHRLAAPPTVKLTYFELIDRFWRLDAERPFTAIETRLYFYLLNLANGARWPDTLPRRLKQICADLSTSDKTISKAVDKLEQRGLLTTTDGHRFLAARYSLAYGELFTPMENEPESAPINRKNSGRLAQDSTESAPQSTGKIPDDLGGDKGVSPQINRKNSGYMNKEEDKTVSSKTRQEARAATAALGGTKKTTSVSAAHSQPADQPPTQNSAPPSCAAPPAADRTDWQSEEGLPAGQAGLIELYFRWFRAKYGVSPRFVGKRDGQAAKEIYEHLSRQSNNTDKHLGALHGMRWLLEGWHIERCYSDYNRRRRSLHQIAEDLTNLIADRKTAADQAKTHDHRTNGPNATAGGHSKPDRYRVNNGADFGQL